MYNTIQKRNRERIEDFHNNQIKHALGNNFYSPYSKSIVKESRFKRRKKSKICEPKTN